MKKLLLILLCLPLLFTTCKKEEDNTPTNNTGNNNTGNNSTQTYIPDDNFEAYLENNGMGNGISNDNYVTTANINLVTNLFLYNKSIEDLTGIEDFIALDSLDCSYNQLTTLNVSNNSSLTYLKCDANNIASIDLHNNTNLHILWISLNELTSLEISNNAALNRLGCLGNKITSLDVSNNTTLILLQCNDNELTSLDLRNGNNHNMDLAAYNNQNLSCINVDNASWATSNWPVNINIGPNHYFSENCP